MILLYITLALCAFALTAAFAYDKGHQAATRTHLRIMSAIRVPPMSKSKRNGE